MQFFKRLLAETISGSSGFSRKSRVEKEAECAKYFKRNLCPRQLLGNICQLHIFFIRKGVQEKLDSNKNVSFLLKIVYVAFGFTTFAKAAGAPCPLPL